MIIVQSFVIGLVLAITGFLGMGNVSVFAASGPPYCKPKSFFSLPVWYKYLPEDPIKSDQTKQCEVSFTLMDGGQFKGTGVLLVGLAIIDIMIRAAALIAFGFVIFGGFKYMTSQGSPDGTKGALSTIINASIGLLVAILAAAIVSFIGYSIG